jgi:hypothetical protein
MNRTLSVLALMMMMAATAVAQSTQSFPNIPIGLYTLGQTYHISTGFEKANADSTPLTLDLSGKEVARVFDALVVRHPDYVWNLRDGVYDLYPRRQDGSLSQLSIANFLLANATREQAQEALFNQPKVKDWLLQHHARRNMAEEGSGLGPGPAGPFPETKRISLSISNVELRSILNQLINKFDRPQWIIGHTMRREYGQDVEYISIEP